MIFKTSLLCLLFAERRRSGPSAFLLDRHCPPVPSNFFHLSFFPGPGVKNSDGTSFVTPSDLTPSFLRQVVCAPRLLDRLPFSPMGVTRASVARLSQTPLGQPFFLLPFAARYCKGGERRPGSVLAWMRNLCRSTSFLSFFHDRMFFRVFPSVPLRLPTMSRACGRDTVLIFSFPVPLFRDLLNKLLGSASIGSLLL